MKLVVMASGSGSNFQALIDDPVIAPHIAGLVCNRPGAGCLKRAAEADITSLVVDHTQFADRESFEAALIQAIDAMNPDWLILAGFMRILTAGFVNHYADSAINIHPSLLPKYQGLNTHQRAIDAGDTVAGVSVHLVTAELDGGPLIGQRSIEIDSSDTAESLAQRVLIQEHELYPAVIRKLISGELSARDGQVFLNQTPLTDTQQF